MRAHLKACSVYYGLFILWAILGGFVILTTDHGDLHLTINNANVFGNDTFFTWATWLGDGYFAYSLALVLCCIRFRSGASVFLACLFAGLTSQILKEHVFGPVPRPVAYFGEPTPLYLVPGLDQHLAYSFPSGHSAIAFALATALMLLRPRTWTQILLFALALLAAYSRVYLSQHFFEDIYAGSFIGLAAGLIAHRLIVVHKQKVAAMETAETEPAI